MALKRTALNSYAVLHTDGHECTTNPIKCSSGWSLVGWFKQFDPYVCFFHINTLVANKIVKIYHPRNHTILSPKPHKGINLWYWELYALPEAIGSLGCRCNS